MPRADQEPDLLRRQDLSSGSLGAQVRSLIDGRADVAAALPFDVTGADGRAQHEVVLIAPIAQFEPLVHGRQRGNGGSSGRKGDQEAVAFSDDFTSTPLADGVPAYFEQLPPQLPRP